MLLCLTLTLFLLLGVKYRECYICFNPLSANTTQWSNALKQFVFDLFVGLILRGLITANDSDLLKSALEDFVLSRVLLWYRIFF